MVTDCDYCGEIAQVTNDNAGGKICQTCQTKPAPQNTFNIRTHNGTITIENRASGDYRTFRIKTQPKDSDFFPGCRIVSLLTGADNENDYQSFGILQPTGTITLWKKHRTSSTYFFFCDMLLNPQNYETAKTPKAPLGYAYHYEGRCRVCNRKLTTPESITSGIGPICAGRT